MIDIALGWLDKGIVPIPTDGKIAAVKWAEWQSKLPYRSQVERWFKNGHYNLGLITGNGLVVLDFDSCPVYWRWRLDHPQYAASYTVTTPRPGKHVYFYVTGESVDTGIKVKEGLDIKGSGGYVLAPPSVMNGKAYRVATDGPIMTVEKLSDLVTLPSDNLGAIAPKTPRPPINSSASTLPVTACLYRGLAGDIKARLTMLEVASRFTELHSTSQDGVWYMGLCPCHDDHAPSFRIDAVNNIAKCLSSKCILSNGNGNDVIDLYQKANKISNRQALFELGREAGLLK